MKKCNCCSKSGLFLKLKNGVCLECYDNIKKLENEYKSLLVDCSSPNSDKSKLIPKITMLAISLRKYDSVSSSIKSSDADKLLDYIMHKNSDRLNIEKPKILKDCSIIPIPKPINKDMEDEPKEEEQLEHECKTEPQEEKQLEYEYEIEDEPEIIQNNIDSLTSNNYKNIMYKILNDNDMSICERCKNYFLLKDGYENNLKHNNIENIDNINISNLLSMELKKLSLSLNRNEQEIYDYYNYVVLAIQTSGIKAKNNSILEISALKIKYGEIVDTFHTFVKPIFTLSLNTLKRTRLDLDILNKSPSIYDIEKDFLNFIGDLKIISFNSKFDLGFLSFYHNELFGSPISNKEDSALKLFRINYKRFYGEPPKDTSINFIYNELLDCATIDEINSRETIALQNSLGTFKIYEALKEKYK